MRSTVPSAEFVTQTAPSPAATSVGVVPTGTSATSLFEAGSTKPTELPAAASINSVPPPCPKAKMRMAIAAAITPARPASRTVRRRTCRGSATFSAFSGGNSV
jgi:hypothetical protein